MIDIIKKKDCCGCGACAQICPKGCISMTADKEGFLYPVVDRVACVRCGACDRVCPVLNPKELEPAVIGAYAAYAKDEIIREESSSGGVFSLLAEWALNCQGVIFGAAFADDFSVHHVRIDRAEDLHKLRGSKYVQSRIEDTYRETKAALESGRVVLFSGVGCQIAGLKAFLGKDYRNLHTVDVLCHGVPSPKIWEIYLAHQKKSYGSEIFNISFRRKTLGWKNFSMEIAFQNGRHYSQSLSDDVFMKFFLSNICLRPSCYSCRFKELPRLSDLTIGDAWGIGSWMPEMDDDRGTSVILINSGKGQRLWDEVRQQTRTRKGDVDTLLPPGADSRKSVAIHPKRARFFMAVNSGAPVEKLVRMTKRSLPRRLLSKIKRILVSGLQ